MIDAGGPRPLWMVLSLGKWFLALYKALWVSQDEQASKQHPFVTSASAPFSRFLPCLIACPGFLQWWTPCGSVNQTNSFLPNLLLAMVFITAIETLLRPHNLSLLDIKHTDESWNYTLPFLWIKLHLTLSVDGVNWGEVGGAGGGKGEETVVGM